MQQYESNGQTAAMQALFCEQYPPVPPPPEQSEGQLMASPGSQTPLPQVEVGWQSPPSKLC